MISIFNKDCIDGFVEIQDNSIDLTVTSPPYDNPRNDKYYEDSSWTFDKFKEVAQELYRVTKDGGVVVWIVGDATIDGSETCSSFKQALHFVDCGFKLHDTMIYEKSNPLPQNHNRYEQCFEYMFVFSKGKPKTFNPIKENTKYYGREMNWSNRKDAQYKRNRINGYIKVKETKNHRNIFSYSIGGNNSGHQAVFPYKLAYDHIRTWSNIGDTVLDPFIGSGTTAIASFRLNRNVIGFEINTSYFKIAQKRIDDLELHPIQEDLFSNIE